MYGDAGLREGTKFGPHMTEPRSFNARHPVQHGTVVCYTNIQTAQKELRRGLANTHGLDPKHQAVNLGKLPEVLTALLAARAEANGAEQPPTLEQAAQMGPVDPTTMRCISLFACPGRGCLGACACEGALLHNQAVAKLDEQRTIVLRRALANTHGLDPKHQAVIFGKLPEVLTALLAARAEANGAEQPPTLEQAAQMGPVDPTTMRCISLFACPGRGCLGACACEGALLHNQAVAKLDEQRTIVLRRALANTHGLDPKHQAVIFGKLPEVLTALLAARAEANGAEQPPTLEQAAQMGPVDPTTMRCISLFACPGRGCLGACACEGALLHNQAVAKLDEQRTIVLRRALANTHGLDPKHQAVIFGKLPEVLTALLAARAEANGAEQPPTLEQAAQMGPVDPTTMRCISLFACPGRGCLGACACEGALLHNQAVAKLDEQRTIVLRRALANTHGLDPKHQAVNLGKLPEVLTALLAARAEANGAEQPPTLEQAAQMGPVDPTTMRCISLFACPGLGCLGACACEGALLHNQAVAKMDELGKDQTNAWKQARRKGKNICTGCGEPGGGWTTCSRNPANADRSALAKGKTPIHEDGDGEPFKRNGRKLSYVRPYFAARLPPPPTLPMAKRPRQTFSPTLASAAAGAATFSARGGRAPLLANDDDFAECPF
jgi:hypothetical protein